MLKICNYCKNYFDKIYKNFKAFWLGTFFLSLKIKNEMLVKFKVLRSICSNYICITAVCNPNINKYKYISNFNGDNL